MTEVVAEVAEVVTEVVTKVVADLLLILVEHIHHALDRGTVDLLAGACMKDTVGLGQVVDVAIAARAPARRGKEQ